MEAWGVFDQLRAVEAMFECSPLGIGLNRILLWEIDSCPHSMSSLHAIDILDEKGRDRYCLASLL